MISLPCTGNEIIYGRNRDASLNGEKWLSLLEKGYAQFKGHTQLEAAWSTERLINMDDQIQLFYEGKYVMPVYSNQANKPMTSFASNEWVLRAARATSNGEYNVCWENSITGDLKTQRAIVAMKSGKDVLNLDQEIQEIAYNSREYDLTTKQFKLNSIKTECSYNNIDGNNGKFRTAGTSGTLQEITNLPTSSFNVSSSNATESLEKLLDKNGDPSSPIMVSTFKNTDKGLISYHFFVLKNYKNDVFTLYNPHGNTIQVTWDDLKEAGAGIHHTV